MGGGGLSMSCECMMGILNWDQSLGLVGQVEAFRG